MSNKWIIEKCCAHFANFIVLVFCVSVGLTYFVQFDKRYFDIQYFYINYKLPVGNCVKLKNSGI